MTLGLYVASVEHYLWIFRCAGRIW